MLSAQFHKKTKPQTSNCKAASAALSGFAFHQGVPGWRSHESPGGAFDRPNRSALCADAIRRFRAARLQPSALHLPPCSDFAMLRSSCRTFVFLCRPRVLRGPILKVAVCKTTFLTGVHALRRMTQGVCAGARRSSALSLYPLVKRPFPAWVLCCIVPPFAVT